MVGKYAICLSDGTDLAPPNIKTDEPAIGSWPLTIAVQYPPGDISKSCDVISYNKLDSDSIITWKKLSHMLWVVTANIEKLYWIATVIA